MKGISMNCPLVSIVVPAYNSEKYISECLNSLLENTYKNFEIIVIDDGSTDNTFNIVSAYKEKHKNIVIIQKKNGGLSSARNKGIEISSGDIIGFVDSDDIVSSNYIQSLLEPIIELDADFSYCLFKRFSSPTCGVNKEVTINNEYKIESLLEFSGDENHVEKVIACAKLFKKNIFDDIAFEYGRYHEDEFLYNKILSSNKIKRVGFVNSQLYFYRTNEDGIMLNSNDVDKKKMDAIDSFLERIEILSRLGFAKKDIRIQRTIDDLNTFITSVAWEKPYCKKRKKYLRIIAKYSTRYKLTIKHKAKSLFMLIFPFLYLYLFLKPIRENIKNRKQIKKNKSAVIYLGSVTHGNLGDQAILCGAKKLLKENDIKYSDLTKEELTPDIIKLIKEKKFIIGLRGGGNIGNVWLNEEKFHRFVIKMFDANKIFFFPESIYFTNDSDGHREKEISAKCYKNATNLKMFLRDELSLERAKLYFDIDATFCPDMALLLKKKIHKAKTIKKCLLLLREDSERNISNCDVDVIKDTLTKNNISFCSSTTIDGDYIPKRKRTKKILLFMNKISKYDLVITDRLHGMIFSYDCGIPCISLNNNNGKVSSVAQQLSKSNSVICLDDNIKTEKIIKAIKELQTSDEKKIQFTSLYNSIIQYIKNNL